MISVQNNTILMIKKGKQKYFEKFIREYSAYIVAVVKNSGGVFVTKEDIEELVSDVFLAIWENRENLKEDENIKSYLASIARNKTKNLLRYNSTRFAQSSENIELNSTEDDVLSNIISEEKVFEIQELINEFDFPEKDILYGYYFYEMKLEYIANKLNLPLSTVKSKLYRCRKKLQNILKEEGFHEEII